MPTYRVPVEIVYPGSGGPGVNVWHVRTTGDFPSTGELAGLSESIRDFYDAISEIYTPQTTLSFQGVATTVEESPQFDTSASPWTVVGTSPSASLLPPANAIVVGWLTNSATRSGRGRTFLGPIALPAAQANGTVEEGPLATIRAAAEALVEFSEGNLNGSVGVYSPQEGVIRDTTGSRVRDLFAVLRSRRD